MSITKSAFTKILAVLTACGLFACAAEGPEDPVTEQSSTEPTLFSDDSPTVEGEEPPRGAEGSQHHATGARAEAISHNHSAPHALVIPATALVAREGGTFALTPGGSAFGETHTHDVALTPTQLAELTDGARLTVETTAGGARGGHTHFVTIARR